MLPYWIKERRNPQLETYYVPMGQMSRKAAKRHESPIYGHNVMHRFATEEEYRAQLERLGHTAQSVHPEREGAG